MERLQLPEILTEFGQVVHLKLSETKFIKFVDN
jgi:hypothetical protein